MRVRLVDVCALACACMVVRVFACAAWSCMVVRVHGRAWSCWRAFVCAGAHVFERPRQAREACPKTQICRAKASQNAAESISNTHHPKKNKRPTTKKKPKGHNKPLYPNWLPATAAVATTVPACRLSQASQGKSVHGCDFSAFPACCRQGC